MTNPYPWLHVSEDGSIGADLQDCTSAEMDRRLVIMQEIEAGRVVVASDKDAEIERLRDAMRSLHIYLRPGDNGMHTAIGEACGVDACIVCLAEATALEALTPPAPSRSPRSASP